MLKQWIKRYNVGKQGSTLIMVLIAFSFFAILGVAMLTASSVSVNYTMMAQKKQQADYIAQSAAKSALSYINANSIAISNGLTGNVAFNGQTNVNGSIEIDSVPGDSSMLKIVATTTYKGVSGKAVAYVKKSAGVNPASPSQYLFYANGGISDGNLNSNNTGGLLSNGDLTVSGGNQYGGKIMVNGNTKINNAGISLDAITSTGYVSLNGCHVSNDIVSGSYVYLNNSGDIIGGSVYANGYVDFQGAKITGDVKTNSTFTYENSGGSISGSVYADGAVSLNGMNIAGNVLTCSTVDISNSGGTVGGNINANGNITIRGGTINGDVYTNGIFTMSGGEIKGNVYSKGNVTISGGTIDRSVTTSGSLTATGGMIAVNAYVSAAAQSTIGNGIVKGSVSSVNPDYSYSFTPVSYLPKIGVNYTPVTFQNPAITPDVASSLSQSAFENMSNNTFTHNGVLDSTLSSGVLYTIDARSAPIYLLVNPTSNSSFTLPVGTGFRVIGDNNVYFILNNTVTDFNTSQNNYIGSADPSHKINVFIVGGYMNSNNRPVAQNVTLHDHSSFYAAVFIPNGTFTINNDISGPYKNNGINCNYVFAGSVTAKTVWTPWSIGLAYEAVDFTGTPIQNAISGGSISTTGVDGDSSAIGSGSGSSSSDGKWLINGWYSK